MNLQDLHQTLGWKKCQQKLAVILCRIKWKNIDIQTDFCYMDVTRGIGWLLLCYIYLTIPSYRYV